MKRSAMLIIIASSCTGKWIFAQRLEQLLNGIRQHDGAGGVSQQAGARDQGHDAHRHQDGVLDALGVNGQESNVHQRLPLTRDEEEVEHCRKDDNG